MSAFDLFRRAIRFRRLAWLAQDRFVAAELESVAMQYARLAVKKLEPCPR
jgi:hypothetical protein